MGQQDREMNRRALLRGAAVTGVAAPVLAACGSDSGTEQSGSQGGGSESGGSTSGGSGSARATVATSKVPVDGGTILPDEQVVVTQPAQGEYKAFSAVCTHQGCTVSTVKNGTIDCPCHGSQYSIKDGSVVQGPATKPLAAYRCKVQGSTVTVS